jgi:hypothetical protein
LTGGERFGQIQALSVFRFLAYLAPLLAGLVAAWALASTEGRPAPRRLARVGIVFALCLPFGLAGVVALSLAALVATAYLAARALRVPAGPAQVVASLIPVALYALLFVLGPVSGWPGANHADVGRRVTLALELDPISVLAVSVFEAEFYHRPTFYALDYAAYQHAAPRWTGTVAMYLAAAAALGAVAFALRRKSA